MPERSIHNILNESFPKSNKEDWLRIASQELNGKNPLENLTWKIDSLSFYPYYDQSDIKALDYLKKFHAPPDNLPYSAAGAWQNLLKISVSDEKTANRRALKYLAAGADGVLFDVTGSIDVDINQLLEKINWPYCNISFLALPTEKFVSKISLYVVEQGYDPSIVTGSIFWKQYPENKEGCIQVLSSLKKIRCLGLVIPLSSPVQEISSALEQGVLTMDYLTNLGIEKEIAFRNFSLSLFCGENFFMTIAKFKALRLLWYQLSQAFGLNNYKPYDLHLHANAEKITSEKFQPHGNMLKNTIDALASVLGGCNAVTLPAEDDGNETMNRVGLYVSNILKEESHIDKVADALAGAYAIENMVNELAQAAWKDFQNKMSS